MSTRRSIFGWLNFLPRGSDVFLLAYLFLFTHGTYYSVQAYNDPLHKHAAENYGEYFWASMAPIQAILFYWMVLLTVWIAVPRRFTRWALILISLGSIVLRLFFTFQYPEFWVHNEYHDWQDTGAFLYSKLIGFSIIVAMLPVILIGLTLRLVTAFNFISGRAKSS